MIMGSRSDARPAHFVPIVRNSVSFIKSNFQYLQLHIRRKLFSKFEHDPIYDLLQVRQHRIFQESVITAIE